jgi:hypothetical protein
MPPLKSLSFWDDDEREKMPGSGLNRRGVNCIPSLRPMPNSLTLSGSTPFGSDRPNKQAEIQFTYLSRRLLGRGNPIDPGRQHPDGRAVRSSAHEIALTLMGLPGRSATSAKFRAGRVPHGCAIEGSCRRISGVPRTAAWPLRSFLKARRQYLRYSRVGCHLRTCLLRTCRVQPSGQVRVWRP